ncbi:MAG: hypothetical protein ACOC9Y_01165 [Chloroflexota bacterium]
MWHFEHRYATFRGANEHDIDKGNARDFVPSELVCPDALAIPRFWIRSLEVIDAHPASQQRWLFGFRNITNTTNERTAVGTVIPLSGVGNSMPVLVPEQKSVRLILEMSANWSAFALDYVVRQKMGNTNFNFFIVRQIPLLAPG